MKKNFEICDCTLRDGGYYTNWNFDKKFVLNYLKTMEAIKAIDVVEIGYRSLPKDEYYGEYFYCPKYFLKQAREIAPSKKLAVMLNEKDITVKDLTILDDCIGYIDLIRLAVNPDNLDRALGVAKHIKDKGFAVGFNLMYMSQWANDNEFISKLKITEGKVDYLYLVDSFGGVYPEDVTSLISNIKKTITTPIGFHGHNNLELALINSIKSIEAGCNIIDGTITGMGRGAGNLRTELLLTYLSAKDQIDINLNTLSETVNQFENFKKNHQWGTNLPYMISGAFSLPQAEVMSWISKHRYTVDSIVNALQNRKDKVIDNVELKPIYLKRKPSNVIIIGGGLSTKSNIESLNQLLESKQDCILVHAGCKYVNDFSRFNSPQYIAIIAAEANKLDYIESSSINESSVFITSPSPREMGLVLPKNYEINTYELDQFTFTKKYHDSLLAIALEFAIQNDPEEINLVGFDGYDLKTDEKMLEVSEENQYLLDSFTSFSNIPLNSYTATNYKNIKSKSIFSQI